MAIVIQQVALANLAREILMGHGADGTQARVVAEVLAHGDASGLPNQGCWRLSTLCKQLQQGAFHCPCHLKVEPRADALIAVDGDSGMGHYVAVQAMQLAIEGARKHGVMVALVRNSNFFGAAGYYAEMAARVGCIGWALSNSFPKVAAHGGVSPVLGTNPLAMAAPRSDDSCMTLDMATAAAAGSSVRRAAERGETLAAGIALDADGQATVDPAAVAALRPVGGAKGYGLGLMVEVMSGVLTGAGIGEGVRSMIKDAGESGENGHFLMALDIRKLMAPSVFSERMGNLSAQVKGSGTEQAKPRLPGESRQDALRRSRAVGIDLGDELQATLTRLAKAADVRVPWAAPVEVVSVQGDTRRR